MSEIDPDILESMLESGLVRYLDKRYPLSVPGSAVSGLCRNGVVESRSASGMCKIQWDGGGEEWMLAWELKPCSSDS